MWLDTNKLKMHPKGVPTLKKKKFEVENIVKIDVEKFEHLCLVSKIAQNKSTYLL